MKRIRKVLLVDGQPPLRDGLALLINKEPDLEICGEADDVHAIFEVIRLRKPEVAVLDISEYGRGRIELIEQIATRSPNLPVVALSTYHSAAFAHLVLEAGAKGYVAKRDPTAVFFEAIRHVLNGGTYVSERARADIVEHFLGILSRRINAGKGHLSKRESSVLERIGLGKSSAQIADELCVGVKTVETYRRRIKMKLSLNTSSELLQHAIEWTKSIK